MSVVMVRRLQGLHALLEMALRDERSRPRPDARAVAGLKKKKLAVRDQLAAFDGAPMHSEFRQHG